MAQITASTDVDIRSTAIQAGAGSSVKPSLESVLFSPATSGTFATSISIIAPSVVPASDTIPTTPKDGSYASDTRKILIGALACGVFVVVILTGLCIYYFLRRRQVGREPMKAAGNVVSAALPLYRQVVVKPYISSGSTLDAAQENPVLPSPDSIPPVRPQDKRSSFTKDGQINPGAAIYTTTLTPTAQQSADLVSTEWGNSATRARAVDAGRVSANADAEEEGDSASTLPPEYGDIFNISRSTTVSTRR